jgi:hypothetical protein
MRVIGILAGFAIAAAVTPVCLGQGADKVVMWSGQPTCGWKSARARAAESYKCFALPTGRGSVSSIAHDGLTLSVAFLDHEDFMIAAVQIKNSSRDPLNFDPDSFGAAHFKERKDFIEGKKPIVAESAIPTREKVREMSSQVRTDNSAGDFMADIQMTSETIAIRKADGTVARVKRIVPDKQAQTDEESMGEIRSSVAQKKMAKMRENALTARYAAPGEAVKGLVYFRRVKKAEFVVFSFTLLDTEYVFMLPKTQRPRA